MLHAAFEEFDEHFALVEFGHVGAGLAGRLAQEVDIVELRLIDAERLSDTFRHTEAAPRTGEAHLLLLRDEADFAGLVGGMDGGGDLAEHLFGELHHVLPGRVGLVELEHGELGVVLARQALVAEVAVDLVDPLHAANEEPLEVELRRDAHEELHVERVVVGRKGTGRRAARRGMHHGRLDLEVVAAVEEAADGTDDAGPLVEDLAHLVVHHQVDVAHAVALLDIGQPFELVWERADALGEHDDLGRGDRKFARLRTHQRAAEAEDVAEVEGEEAVEELLTYAAERDEDLQEVVIARRPLEAIAAGAIGNLEEGGLPHLAEEAEASGNGHGDGPLGELLGGQRTGLGIDLRGCVAHLKAVGEGAGAGLAEGVDLGHTLLHDVVVEAVAIGGDALVVAHVRARQ